MQRRDPDKGQIVFFFVIKIVRENRIYFKTFRIIICEKRISHDAHYAMISLRLGRILFYVYIAVFARYNDEKKKTAKTNWMQSSLSCTPRGQRLRRLCDDQCVSSLRVTIVGGVARKSTANYYVGANEKEARGSCDCGETNAYVKINNKNPEYARSVRRGGRKKKKPRRFDVHTRFRVRRVSEWILLSTIVNPADVGFITYAFRAYKHTCYNRRARVGYIVRNGASKESDRRLLRLRDRI